MIEKNTQEIKNILERLVQPLDAQEKERLREEVFRDSTMRGIHMWRGYHLYDKERYEMCKEMMVTPHIIDMEFSSWMEAAGFLCTLQLKRSDLTLEYRKYLIGQIFNFERIKNGEDNKPDAKLRVASELSSILHFAAGTVIKYGAFASSVDVIFDADNDFAKSILSGKIKVSHENVVELSRLKGDEIRTVARSAREEKLDHITFSYIRNEVKWSYMQQRNPSIRRERREEKETEKPAIRKMPEYDPDAEVNSLCMTIDYWISSIQRVNNSDNMIKITNKASLQLMKKLSFLEHSIQDIQRSLVERTGE